MILAVIFDLDGTLVETEELKARSYAQAAIELRPELREAEIIEAFKDMVGLSRQEVAVGLMQRFGLEEAARARMADFGVDTPWQAYVQLRQGIYQAMLDDPELLRSQVYLHNIAYLREMRQKGLRTALATMSYRAQVQQVLAILGLTGAFDFIASREDVEHGKPDPEIYFLVARQLAIPPEDCLVLEDSLTGVKAALAAGMNVVAVSTPFTRQRLYESLLLPREHIVGDPAMFPQVVEHIIAHHRHKDAATDRNQV